MSRRLSRILAHGQCFTFPDHQSKICGRDEQHQRLQMRSGKNRGRATRKTRSESTILVSSALLRPPSLTSSIERSKIAQCKKAHCACQWPCEEEKTITRPSLSDRSISSRCRWRKGSVSESECCAITCIQTVHQRRSAAFPTLESGARADEDKRPCQ